MQTFSACRNARNVFVAEIGEWKGGQKLIFAKSCYIILILDWDIQL